MNQKRVLLIHFFYKINLRKEDDNNRNAYKEYTEMKGIKNAKHYY